jgi:hypothetical protein
LEDCGMMKAAQCLIVFDSTKSGATLHDIVLIHNPHMYL